MPAGLRSAAATCANRQAGLNQTHHAERIKDAVGRTRSGRLVVGTASTRHSARTEGQRDDALTTVTSSTCGAASKTSAPSLGFQEALTGAAW